MLDFYTLAELEDPDVLKRASKEFADLKTEEDLTKESGEIFKSLEDFFNKRFLKIENNPISEKDIDSISKI